MKCAHDLEMAPRIPLHCDRALLSCRPSGQSHVSPLSRLEILDHGASEITVSQLRQEKVSSCGLSSRDRLSSIAVPQSGHCLIVGRGSRGIRSAAGDRLAARPPGLAVSPTQSNGKNAESDCHGSDHDRVCRHRMSFLGLRGAILPQVLDSDLDPDQITVVNGIAAGPRACRPSARRCPQASWLYSMRPTSHPATVLLSRKNCLDRAAGPYR
jgi:hypothetical protein